MEPAKKSMPSIMPDRFGLSEEKRRDWIADIPDTVSIDEIMDPSYWAHIASQMQPMDHIEARREDGAWIAYLVVQFCEKNYATVVLDRRLNLTQEGDIPASSIKHYVKWKGPVLKWVVIRSHDSQILKDLMLSRDEAAAWMIDHEKTLGN